MSGGDAARWRRTAGRTVLVVACTQAFACVAAAVAWWQLPTWAPHVVVARSPWVDPIMRSSADSFGFTVEKCARMSDLLGDRLVDRGAPYLSSTDARIRRDAAMLLALNVRRPGASDALAAAADRGTWEAVEELAGIADGRYTMPPRTGDDELRERARSVLRSLGVARER